MERFVHRQNVEHYREMLKTVTDPAQREKIRKLLAEEEAALAKQKKNTKNRGDRFHVRFGSKRTYAVQKGMSALPLMATAKADILAKTHQFLAANHKTRVTLRCFLSKRGKTF